MVSPALLIDLKNVATCSICCDAVCEETALPLKYARTYRHIMTPILSMARRNVAGPLSSLESICLPKRADESDESHIFGALLHSIFQLPALTWSVFLPLAKGLMKFLHVGQDSYHGQWRHSVRRCYSEGKESVLFCSSEISVRKFVLAGSMTLSPSILTVFDFSKSWCSEPGRCELWCIGLLSDLFKSIHCLEATIRPRCSFHIFANSSIMSGNKNFDFEYSS